MTSSIEGRYLVQLLGSVLHGTRPPHPPTSLSWERLYRIAAFHLVSAMVSSAIDQLPGAAQPDLELVKRFHSDRRMAMAREAHQHVHLEQMLRAFQSHGIACLPLKGCLLKDLYPSAEMRIMVDLDLLIDDQPAEKIHGLMLDLGYTLRSQGEVHDVYVKQPLMTVEIHRCLMPERVGYGRYFDQVWNRVICEDDSGFRLAHEDFYIYLIAHLAKHGAGGGIGIRSVMDVWLYNEHYRQAIISEYTRSELQGIGLRAFAENIEQLGRVWFGDESGDRWHEEMTDFILSSGSAGTRRNAIAVEAAKSAKGGVPFAMAKCTSLLKLLFPPLKTMRVGYPYLRRFPAMLPLAWAWRGAKSMLLKGRSSVQVLEATVGVTEPETERVREFYERLGLMD